MNACGQCGDGTTDDIHTPKEIWAGDGRGGDKAAVVRCGSNHSYIMTCGGRHLLFGSNRDNECGTFIEIMRDIHRPTEMSIRVLSTSDSGEADAGRLEVSTVFPGHSETKVLLVET